MVTGAADTKVHVHDLTVKETIHMFSDHTNRVKRIATAPMWPNTFWSAAEDGIIRLGAEMIESVKRYPMLNYATGNFFTFSLFPTDSMT